MKILLIALCVCIISCEQKQSENDPADFEYTESEGKITITKYIGSIKDIRIPAKIDGLPVVAIGDDACAYNELTSVIIPNTVTHIGENAFFGNNKLTNITIPNSVTHIGAQAFYQNQLTSVTLPKSLVYIGGGAFNINKLTKVTIPNSVTHIGNRAFFSNQITKVTIPKSVTHIGYQAFYKNRLTSITLPANVDIHYDSFYLSLYDKYVKNGKKKSSFAISLSTVDDFKIAVLDDSVFEIIEYNGKVENVIIPEKINGASVIAIGYQAFINGHLTNITIPNSVIHIGEMAFFSNNLTSVTIPDAVTFIGDEAFHYNQLTSVTILDSVTHIGDEAFRYNQLTSVTLPDNVDIDASSFYVSLYDKYVKNGKKKSTFAISLSTVDNFEIAILDDSILEITGYNDKIVEDIIIPERIHGLPVVFIGYRAFSYFERLASVTIPNSVTYIGTRAFFYNRLTSITIPNSVTHIGDQAFFYNRLTSVTIPSSVTHIGDRVFDNDVEIIRQ